MKKNDLFIIIIFAFTLSCFINSQKAFSDDYICRDIHVGLELDEYWEWTTVGEDLHSFVNPRMEIGVKRFFEGDNIPVRLYIGSECRRSTISEKDLQSALLCLRLEVYEDDTKNFHGLRYENTPFCSLSLENLTFDELDSWNIKNRQKEYFIATEASPDGLFTRSFNLKDHCKNHLISGEYTIKIDGSESCKYRILGSEHRIRIYKIDNMKMKATKMCVDYYYEKRRLAKIGPLGNGELLMLFVSKIIPAFVIDPNNTCVLGSIADYYRRIGNFDNYALFKDQACKSLKYEKLRNICLENLARELNYKNPK